MGGVLGIRDATWVFHSKAVGWWGGLAAAICLHMRLGFPIAEGTEQRKTLHDPTSETGQALQSQGAMRRLPKALTPVIERAGMTQASATLSRTRKKSRILADAAVPRHPHPKTSNFSRHAASGQPKKQGNVGGTKITLRQGSLKLNCKSRDLQGCRHRGLQIGCPVLPESEARNGPSAQCANEPAQFGQVSKCRRGGGGDGYGSRVVTPSLPGCIPGLVEVHQADRVQLQQHLHDPKHAEEVLQHNPAHIPLGPSDKTPDPSLPKQTTPLDLGLGQRKCLLGATLHLDQTQVCLTG